MSTEDRTQTRTLTRVDLGDDLLEATRTSVPAMDPEKIEGPAEKISSARILLGEGLVDDAKKTLRSILLNESERDYWSQARAGLEEILNTEMNQLLKRDAHRPSSARATPLPGEDSIREIEERWGAADLLEAEELLFSADSERTGFVHGLEKRLSDVGAETRLDLVSGLMEMTLYRVAEMVVRPLVQDAVHGPSAAELQARILMLTERPFEATQILEDFLSRSELATDVRYGFFYLMGCAYQQMNRAQEARGWFAELLKRSGGYRDTESRLKQLV